MHLRQHWGKGAAAVLLGLLLTGCPKEKPEAAGPASTTPNAAGGSSMTIAVIPKGTQASYWLSVKAGAEAAGKEEKAQILWQGPSDENDISAQNDIIRNQISNHISGIVLAATNADSQVDPVKEAVAKGIPVVTIDSGLKPDQDASACFISTDNVAAAGKAADEMAKAIGSAGGKIIVLAFNKGAQSSDDRENGFKDAMKKYPNIQIVATDYANKPAAALDMITNMVTAHPDVVGIFAANEPGGIGAANYIQQKNLAGKIKVVAFDTADAEVKALQDGTIQGLVVQDPYKMGYEGVKNVVKLIKKEAVAQKRMDSGVTIVTKDNLNSPDVQKMLHPTT